MSGGGDDLFGPYSQPDHNFCSYNPAPPPFSPPRADNSRNLIVLGQGFDLNNPYGASSSASAHGGLAGPSHGYGGPMNAATPQGCMAGPSHGYSGYGGPSGLYQMLYHAGGLQMPQPARHSTSSISGFAGGPFAPLPPNQLPPMLPTYGPYGEGSIHGGRVNVSHASPSLHPATMRDEEMSSAAPRRTRGPRTQESSTGDNDAIVGDAAAVDGEQGSEGSVGGEVEGSSSDGDFDWSSDDDSSDEHYEELYKALDDGYGDEEPDIVQAIKELSEDSRRGLKLLKKAVMRGMYEDCMDRHDDDDMDLEISAFLATVRSQDTDDEAAESSREADESDDDINMNVVRDDIAHAYYMSQQRR